MLHYGRSEHFVWRLVYKEVINILPLQYMRLNLTSNKSYPTPCSFVVENSQRSPEKRRMKSYINLRHVTLDRKLSIFVRLCCINEEITDNQDLTLGACFLILVRNVLGSCLVRHKIVSYCDGDQSTNKPPYSRKWNVSEI